MKKKNEEITLKDLFDLFRPKLWIVLIVSVLVSAVAWGYSAFLKDETYTSSAMIYIYSETSNSPTANEITTAKSMSETYKIIFTNTTYLKHVINRLPESYAQRNLSPGQIRGLISVSAVNETQVLRISVTSTDKTLSYDLAKTMIDIAPERIKETIPNAMSISLVEYPELAASHNSKNAARNAVVAFAAAFVLCLIAIWVFSMFDVTVRDAQKIETTLDLPVLGVIPLHEVESVQLNTTAEVKR